jgi:hypothetical protein
MASHPTETLTFYTGDDLTAAELADLLQALDRPYRAFLALDWASNLLTQTARTERFFEEPSYSETPDPEPPRLRPSSGAAGSTSQEMARAIAAARTEIGQSERQASLQIAEIRISSPGVVALFGNGRALRQLRLLIRDVWWKNRENSRRARLTNDLLDVDLVESRARVRFAVMGQIAEFETMYDPFPPKEREALVSEVMGGIATLDTLADRGNLLENRTQGEIGPGHPEAP